MDQVANKRTVVRSALKVLPLSVLQVDPSYQRLVKPKHKKIVTDFNEVALGIPLVGEREDGSMWVVDGLQRVTALHKLNKTTVRCEVFASQGPEHEAEVFKLVNMNRTRLSPNEEFRALLTSGDELAWRVKETVEAEGFKILLGPGRGNTTPDETASRQLTCINTLVDVVKRNGAETLRFALRCISKAWPDDRNGPHHSIVGGLSLFFVRHKRLVDEDRLVLRLQLTTPQKIMYTSSQMSPSTSGNRSDMVAEVIEKFYRKRTGKRQ